MIVRDTYELEIQQGATLDLLVQWNDDADVPVSLSGYQARMQLRYRVKDPDPVLSLTSTPAAGLTVEPSGAVGLVEVRIGATQTASLVKSGFYDLELYDPNDPDTVVRLLGGAFVLSPEVTR